MMMKMSGESAIGHISHPIGDDGVDPSKYHFVLVHGFGGGAWGWYKVRTLLEASGFQVTCLDLKASGINLSPLESVHSFDDYTQPLTHFFEHYSPTHSHNKVILVGHSAGGLNVTDATYKFADKIGVAVYVAATMLKHGFATEQDIIDGMPEKLRPGSRPEPDAHNNSNQKMKSRIPPEDVVLGSMLHRPGPLKAILGAKFEGNEKAECVPRIYIRTLQDEALKPEQQEAMIRRWPPARVFALDTDHNPTVSAPFLLAGLLAKATHECFA